MHGKIYYRGQSVSIVELYVPFKSGKSRVMTPDLTIIEVDTSELIKG